MFRLVAGANGVFRQWRTGRSTKILPHHNRNLMNSYEGFSSNPYEATAPYDSSKISLFNTASYESNGRVNLTTPIKSAGGFLANPDAAGFGYKTAVDANVAKAVLKGSWEANPVSNAFFSPENIANLQRQIKSAVKARGGYTIDDQSVDELQIIMRSFYLQYGKNLPANIPGQIAELNKLVIDWSVPTIISEVEMHLHYQRDIDKLPEPLRHPQWMSGAGSRGAAVRSFI
jgi:hypothetical protein